MKYEDSLYCIMERGMLRISSAKDVYSLQKARELTVLEFNEFCSRNVVRSVVEISYRSWIDSTYLMLRTYLKE